MLIEKKLGFLGSGNMGEALVSGLVYSGSAQAQNIICSDIREERLEELHTRYGVRTTTDNSEVVAASEVIVYAVKPQLMAEVLKETSDHLDLSKLVISIAAGVPLRAIESLLHKELRLVRVMPNIAASVKESATALSAGKHARKEDIELAMAIFNSVGKTVFLRENYLMDAITGLSGSGPAYIFIIVDALADGGGQDADGNRRAPRPVEGPGDLAGGNGHRRHPYPRKGRPADHSDQRRRGGYPALQGAG
jgi:pyrroline-5-carboxylate reductase